MQKSLAFSTFSGAGLHTRKAHHGNAVVVPFRIAKRPSLGVRKRLEVVKAQVAEVAQETLRLPRWDYIFDQLNENNVKSVKAKDAQELIKKGYVLVDVRPPHIFEKAHPAGAISVPLFQRVNFSNFSITGYLRAAALALNGVDPVEPNPKFGEQLLQQVGEGGKIILACEAGGSLVPNPSFVTGKESRSLKAAYKAVIAKKYADIKHLSGGVYGWWKADLPFEGEYDLENVGRTPNVVSGDD